MISSNSRCFLPVVALVVALAATARADNLVVPGERVGAVRLGATISQVHHLLGRPSKTSQWKSGETQDSFLGAKPALDADKQEKSPRRNLTVIYRKNRVVQIEFNSPAFRTSRGISVASSLSDFRRAYGPAKAKAFGMDLDEGGYVAYYFDNSKRGIAFSFGTQDYFDATIKPEDIRIYKRGTKVLPDPGGKSQAANDEKPIGELGKGAG